MARHRQLLLEVWQQAGRHLEIQATTTAIFDLLAKPLRIGQIVVRYLDQEQSAITTVAQASEGPTAHGDDRRTLGDDERKRLVRWSASGKLLRRGRRLTPPLSLLAADPLPDDVVAVPLSGDHGPEGALVIGGLPEQEFADDQLEMFAALREPFSVALQNDRRMHELARLRESAEAERGALLRRLGRTDLGETIVGEHGGLRQVMKRVMLVVHSDVPVLILGETGTGKEVIARALHARSPRHQGPFIRVNCGAIPSELIDSQLFGHEKGSFTGASASREGWFERADGGTLLLDEIGELPLEAQVRLLRVLQDGFVERVGGSDPVHVDVRVIAATHRDLATMVRQREFREDLWYRLAVFPILLPPLRERRDDIPEMVRHFAERAALRFGLPPVEPTDEDLQLLLSYDWPGNIRELGAVIDRAAILGEGQRLEVAKALGWNHESHTRAAPSMAGGGVRPESGDEPVVSLDEAMRRHIQRALVATGGRIEGRQGAAALLKINPHTLRARMRKLQIDWSQFRAAE